MNIEINKNLFSIMMLYSLPVSFENFRCAIGTRDELPNAEALKVKILEESQVRKSNSEPLSAMAAAMPNKNFHKNKSENNGDDSRLTNNNRARNYNKFSNMTCYKCKRRGHIATYCR